MIREIRVYGLSEECLQERLADLAEQTGVAVTLSYNEGFGAIALTGEQEALDTATACVAERLGANAYSYDGESLATCVVKRLAQLDMTVSTAESCTGGLIAAALTDVPGASRVFGTGVVSYSNQCKENLLTVSGATITVMGAVSAETAGQMARGVRQTGNASVGVAVTGEAGPNPSEDLPVGTVFVALSDKKRTWVEELHLDGADRAVIRRQAANSVLWLLWRYLSAYPTVMAGGENNHIAQKRTIPHTKGSGQPRFLSLILPWKGDSRRRLAIKCTAWLLVLMMLVGMLLEGYQYFVQPHRNLELQESLGDLYREESSDLTSDSDDSVDYPVGMLPVFRGLYDMNEDIGGWLHIPGTELDYPVMNYADGYYENHSFLKEYSIYGQPYFGNPSNQYACLVYGQNTGDGQMFSELLNYRRVAYLQEHSEIECNTIYANKKWQIFAVVLFDDRSPDEFALPTEEFASEEEYMAYITQVQERSMFLSDVTFTEQEELLVLSTDAYQDYGFYGARLAVFARLVKDDAAEITYRVNNFVKMPAAMYQNSPTTTRDTTTTTTTLTDTTESDTTATEDGSTTSNESGTVTESTTLTGESGMTDTTTDVSGTTSEATTEVTGDASATNSTTGTTEATTGITASTSVTTVPTTNESSATTNSNEPTVESTVTTSATTTGSNGTSQDKTTATTTKTTTATTSTTTTGSNGTSQDKTTATTTKTTTATSTSSTVGTTDTTDTSATDSGSQTTDAVITDVSGSVTTTESTSTDTTDADTSATTEATTDVSADPTNTTAPGEDTGEDLMGEDTYANIGY